MVGSLTLEGNQNLNEYKNKIIKKCEDEMINFLRGYN